MSSNHLATSNTFKSILNYFQACALFIASYHFQSVLKLLLGLHWMQLVLTFVCMCFCGSVSILGVWMDVLVWAVLQNPHVMEKNICSWMNVIPHGINLESKLLKGAVYHNSNTKHCIIKWKLGSQWVQYVLLYPNLYQFLAHYVLLRTINLTIKTMWSLWSWRCVTMSLWEQQFEGFILTKQIPEWTQSCYLRLCTVISGSLDVSCC